jgi:tRNA 2-selenouridine synthase
VIIGIDDFLKLRTDLPIIDVRSQLEFSEGHIKDAVNIPLLNNEERIAVGVDYKTRGQAEAIKTGFRLVGPRFLEIINHTEAVSAGREALVHCWRGGMRSSNFCQIVGMAKIQTHQLKGGYKAYREEALKSYKRPMTLRIIGGSTGSGKSEVLRALQGMGDQILDLETIARHKGSVFGGLMMPPQPNTEQFQNDLYEEIQRLDTSRRIWVEDESIAIGRIFLPQDFWYQMCAAPLYQLDVEKNVRIGRLVAEYGKADKEAFLGAMVKITKKLGGQHFKEAKQKLFENDMSATIDILLTYYDNAYATGLANKRERIKDRISWDGADAADCARQLMAISD